MELFQLLSGWVGVIFVPFQHRGHLVIWGRFKRGQVCVMKFFYTCNWFKLFSSTMEKKNLCSGKISCETT